MIFSPSTGTISVNSTLVRLLVRRRKWLLPPFVRTRMPDPVRRKRLDVALWVFILYLLLFTLRGTAKLLSLIDHACGLFARPQIIPEFFDLGVAKKGYPVDYTADLVSSPLCSIVSAAFFREALAGARTMVIVRPSMLGICSTAEISANSWAISFKSSKAISG